MVRNYKKVPGTRVYQNYSKQTLQTALRQIRRGQIGLRDASRVFGIPKSTLSRHKRGPVKKQGGQTVLTEEEEQHLVQLIVLAGEWGYPLDKLDLRYSVKGYLDRKGVRVNKFQNNMPGLDWANSFLSRHKNVLTQRLCENIKRARAGVSHETVNSYFDNLQTLLENAEPNSIVNYDETCFVDDPGRKKVIVRRKTRHPERIIDSAKSSTSVMFAGSGGGILLPPFIVYKSEHIYDTWMSNGPKNARYGRNSSGWFDQPLFENWFENIALPYFKKQPAPRVLIGDNLCSHLSYKVIQLCEQNDIKFGFLPASSTHLTQPLDVAVFAPLKKAWRRVLDDWKKKYKGPIPKQYFPSLLKKTLDNLETMSENIRKGFLGTGLIPLDRNQVLKRLPKPVDENHDPNHWTASVIDLLNDTRNACKPTVTKKKKVSVEPGKSVSREEFAQAGPSSPRIEIAVEDEFDELDVSEHAVDSLSSSDNEEADLDLKILKKDDFVEIQYGTDKQDKYFIGLIQNVVDDELFTVKFLRPNRKKENCFIFPVVDDVCVINKEQIKRLLPQPTALRRGGYQFAKNASKRAYLNH